MILPSDFSEEFSDDSRRIVQSLPFSGRTDNLQLFSRRKLLLEFVVHLRGQLKIKLLGQQIVFEQLNLMLNI